MDKITLSPSALLYGAIRVGSPGFYGVKDVFYGMNDEQIKETLRDCCLELDAQGYGEMTFEGDFHLFKETENLIKSAAFCDRYMQCTFDVSVPHQEIFYFKDSDVLRLTEEDGLLELKKMSPSDVVEHILCELPELRNREDSFCEEISDTVIQLLKQAAHKNEEEQAAVRACKTPNLGKVLLEYYRGEARSVVMTYVCPGTEIALAATYISSAYGDVFLVLEPDLVMPWQMKKTAIPASRKCVYDWIKKR